MLKKIISLGLLVIFMFPQTGFALGDDFKDKINILVDRMSVEQLHSLDAKIEKISESGIKISKKNHEILSYLDDSIEERLIDDSALRDSEKQVVTAEIMKIQDALMGTIEDRFTSLLGEYKKLLYVRETGDFSFTLDVNQQQIGQIQAELKLNNYDAIQNYLDSQISTDFTGFLKLDARGQNIEVDMSGFMDYITKDGNMYVLLDKLNISGENLEDIQEMIDQLQAVADQNSYISIPADASYEEGLALLENLKPSVILSDMRQVFDKPLLRAHSKLGDKYILIPTRYACDQGKIIGDKFDPFYGSDACSDGQYRDLVEDFLSEDIQLYMKLGSQPTLGMTAQDYSSNTTAEMVFDGTQIKTVDMQVTPKNDDYEGFTMSYKYKSHLDASLRTDDTNIVWTSSLNSKNDLTYANLDLEIDDYDTQVSGTLQLKNKDVRGHLGISEDGKQLFYMTTSGSYKVGYVDLQNNFELFENPFESNIEVEYTDEQIPGAECYESYYEDSTYVCYVDKEPSGETISGVFNITADTRYSKNNLDILFQALLGGDEIIKAEIINTAKRESKQIDIQAPTNTTPYDEVFGDEYGY